MPIDKAALNQSLKNISKLDKEATDVEEVSLGVISTGSIAVDHVTGIGGFARGRITEVSGSEHSGKTTLAVMAAAKAQRAGLYAAIVDVECGLDRLYASRLGFNFKDQSKGLLSTPKTFEVAFQTVSELVHAGADLVVLDSIPGLVLAEELQGDIGDASPPALRARALSRTVPKLLNAIRRSGTALIFINQFREDMSSQGWGARGRSEKTAGGRALRYFASMRMMLRLVKRGASTRTVTDVTGDERELPVSSLHEVEIVKSKVSSPYREMNFLIRFDDEIGVYGIDNLATLMKMAQAQGVVALPRGNWIEFNGSKHNGDAAFYAHLSKTPAEIALITDELKKKGFLP